jgi:hypothetical protein
MVRCFAMECRAGFSVSRRDAVGNSHLARTEGDQSSTSREGAFSLLTQKVLNLDVDAGQGLALVSSLDLPSTVNEEGNW